MRFLEYDKTTGRIICEVLADSVPNCKDGFATIEISPDLELDISLCAVRDGQLVRAYESDDERRERERLAQECQQNAAERIKSLASEMAIAQLEQDEAKIAELREEYRQVKALL